MSKISNKRLKKAEKFINTIVSDNGHSLFSPSWSKRWLECELSTVDCHENRDNVDKEHSVEGTVAHAVLSLAILSKKKPRKLTIPDIKNNKSVLTDLRHSIKRKITDTQSLIAYKNSIFKSFKYMTLNRDQAEMIHYITLVYKQIKKYVKKGYSVQTEIESDLRGHVGHSSHNGSVDVVLTNKQKHVIVIDLKYGQGVYVEVENNTQMVLYFKGLMKSNAAKLVTFVIAQPRYDGNEWSEWTPSMKKVNKIFDRLVKVGKNRIITFYEHNNSKIDTSSKQYESAPSIDNCMFCAKKTNCKARLDQHDKNSLNLYAHLNVKSHTDLLLTNVGDIDSDILSNISTISKVMIPFLKTVDVEINKRLQTGKKVKGKRLAVGRSSKDWNQLSESDTKVELREIGLAHSDYLTVKVKSPSAIMKSVFLSSGQKSKISELFTNTNSNPRVVSDSSNAPEFNAIDRYDDLPFLMK